jgi:hypothetical protein
MALENWNGQNPVVVLFITAQLHTVVIYILRIIIGYHPCGHEGKGPHRLVRYRFEAATFPIGNIIGHGLA